jgi:hypothetical protein
MVHFTSLREAHSRAATVLPPWGARLLQYQLLKHNENQERFLRETFFILEQKIRNQKFLLIENSISMPKTRNYSVT